MTKRRGHNAGSIVERRNKEGKIISYQAQLSLPDGRRRSASFRTKREAQRWLDETKAALLQGRLGPSRSQTVGEYVSGWLETVHLGGKPNTYHTYKRNVGRILPRLKGIKLDSLSPAHIQDAYNHLLVTGLSPRTVRHTHAALHKALNDALRLDLVVRNVTDAVTLPRVLRTEMHWYTAEELDKLFQETTEDRFHAMWVVLGTTGIRLGEALGLKWTDIDFGRRTLQVNRALQRRRAGGGLVLTEPKSARGRRTIELSQEACTALRAHQERQAFERRTVGVAWNDNGLVFCTGFGTPLDQGRVHHHWRHAVQKASIPRHRIHDLRHTVATLLIMAGMNVKTVSEMLGHSSDSFTLEVYGHVAPSTRREAANLMDRLLSQSRATM